MALTLQNVMDEIAQLRQDMRTERRKLLSVNELAAQLGCSSKTIRNKLALGDFPIQTVRTAVGLKFRQVDVDYYVDEVLDDG